jgi:hypothetical protein
MSRLLITDAASIDPLEVGVGGYGELNVSAGGQVQVQHGAVSLACCLQPAGDGSGQITVEGQNSRLDATRLMLRAAGGNSRMLIRDHGVVAAGGAYSNIFPGSSHTLDVEVTDVGSLLDIGGLLDVSGSGGDSGGTVTVTTRNGGRIHVAGDVWLWGDSLGAVYVVVDGAGAGTANLNVGGTLYVGGNDSSLMTGTAVITVANNGLITAGDVKVWQPGTLQGNGEVSLPPTGSLYNSGVVAPGLSVGVLTISGGNYVQDADARLAIEIGGRTSSEYDQLHVDDGWAALHGILDVSLIDLGGGLFAPRAGDTFEILTATGGVTEALDLAHSIFPILNGLYWDVDSSSGTSLVLRVQALGMPGDYNQNGVVDAADYVVWRDNVGAYITLPNEDPSQTPGWVTEEDYIVWRAHFGQTAGVGAASRAASARFVDAFVDARPPRLGGPTDAAIPEPATFALLVIAGGLVCVRRRGAHHASCSSPSILRCRASPA